MKLPYAEEIAAIRAELDANLHIQSLAQQAKSALTALDVVQMQHSSGLPVPPMVPGEDVVDTIIATVPELKDLSRIGTSAMDYGSRLRARRQQVDLALNTLDPLLKRMVTLSGELHHLQHQQHEALHASEWADAVAELQELSKMRDQTGLAMVPLRTRVAHLEPVRLLLLAFHPQLEAELVEAARIEDADGRVAWRVGMMAREQLIGLADCIRQLGLALALPTEPALPDTHHPRHRRRLRSEASGVLEWMVQLSSALSDHADTLKEQLDTLEAQHAHYEGLLRERMG